MQIVLKLEERTILEELDEQYICHILILQIFLDNTQNIQSLAERGKEHMQQLSSTTAALTVSLTNNTTAAAQFAITLSQHKQIQEKTHHKLKHCVQSFCELHFFIHTPFLLLT